MGLTQKKVRYRTSLGKKIRTNVCMINSEKQNKKTSKASFFVDKNGGFTSVGVVVALTLCLALLFTSIQVNWVQSTSADIQFVADAGALAGENVVAEYMVIARVADAVILSMSLFGIAVCGVSIVVSCIPGCQAVGVKLMEFGTKVFDARNKCANAAVKALNAIQKALPFLCAANAARVISANQISKGKKIHYVGLAIPLPLTGEDIAISSVDDIKEKVEEVSEKNVKTSQITEAAAEAQEKMRSSKENAFMADCGNAPNYCMMERASRLSPISSAQNPNFSSVDTWIFDYAYARAAAYYNARLQSEKPVSDALNEQVRSYVRKQFFTYAVSKMREGYAITASDGTLDAYFPLMPRNSSELRQCSMYTEQVYPVDKDNLMHGAQVCQIYLDNGAAGYGSLSQLESDKYKGCENCKFSVSTVGNVANASTVTGNGFEYYYRIVAEEAVKYSQAAREYRDLINGAKDSASEAFDAFAAAMELLKTPRLNPHPPGRNGCIAIVLDITSHSVPSGVGGAFVNANFELSPRMAISAAALAEDQAIEGESVLASFLDRAKENQSGSMAGSALGILDGIIDVWGNMLLVYSRGSDSLASAVGDFLRGLPLIRSTPLASWAERVLQETINAFGLQGAKLGTPKPVLVNSLHVARASNTAIGDLWSSLKSSYSHQMFNGDSSLATHALDSLLAAAEKSGGELLESEIELCTISFGDFPGSPQIPVTISLPQNLVESGKNQLAALRSSLMSLSNEGRPGNVWW
jgi:hypothetical protein